MHQKIDTYTIPESYAFVDDVALLLFELTYKDFGQLAQTLTLKSPVAVLENKGVILLGKDILFAFENLEVLECSAEAILDSQPISGHIHRKDAFKSHSPTRTITPINQLVGKFDPLLPAT